MYPYASHRVLQCRIMPTQNQAATGSHQQQRLDCGVDLLLEPMSGYHTATLVLRVEGGMASEPDDHAGLAYVLEQTIDKGTTQHDARQLADAFDVLGASHAIYTGRQSWVFVVSALPELLPRAAELMLGTIVEPTFPEPMVATAVNLTQQQLFALEDSPKALLRRAMAQRAYGPVLGRHQLGTHESLQTIDAERVRDYWRTVATRRGIAIAVAGAFDESAVRDVIERRLGALPEHAAPAPDVGVVFTPGATHINKDAEQTQIGISFPGACYDADDYPVERVLTAVLSGGMSARLFTEVREKRGLVYWVGAWHEQPRGSGMVHLGAATTAQRCRTTYDVLLQELARLQDDLTDEELERAKTGLIAESVTSGASVQRRAGDLLTDHFHLRRARSAGERIEAVRRVTVDDIASYLRRHPRDQPAVVTVGSQALELGGHS